MGRIVIVSTLFDRPLYARRHLDALAACRGVGDCLYLPRVEPGNPEVAALADAVDFCECRPSHAPAPCGASRNALAAIDAGFGAGGGDFVVFAEEDVLLAPDALEFFAWARDRYGSDPSVFSATAYHRGGSGEPGDDHRVSRRQWFHPWGFGTWAGRWRRAGPAARGGVDSGLGWDEALNRLVTSGGLSEVHPLLSRSQNVGEVSSVHPGSWFTADWHAANHRVRHWSGGLRGPTPGAWVESPEV